MLIPGDIIAVHTFFAILSWLIRRLTRSMWNHVVIYVGNGLMVEALGKGVLLRQVCIYEGRRRRWKVAAFRPACSKAIREKAARLCLDAVGLKYDYWLVWGILRAIRNYRLDRKNEFDHASRFGCSELIAKKYHDAGYDLFNTQTIHLSNAAPADCVIGPGDWIDGWPRIKAKNRTCSR